MEISKEIKAKVFAQYLGEKINENNSTLYDTMVSVDLFNESICTSNHITYKLDEVKLVLKPLSSITDEHMIWVYDTSHNLHQQRKLYPKEVAEKSMSLDDMKLQMNNRSVFMTGGWLCNTWNYQYLLSKGYDLEQFLLGYKTLHEAGLAIYEN